MKGHVQSGPWYASLISSLQVHVVNQIKTGIVVVVVVVPHLPSRGAQHSSGTSLASLDVDGAFIWMHVFPKA